MKELRKYKLFLTEGYSEKIFIKNFGKDLFEQLKNESFITDDHRCTACEHQPSVNLTGEHLFFHIYEINEENPSLTKGVTLCKMCHLTQHINSATKYNWVEFVNSVHTQEDLIRVNRGCDVDSEKYKRNIIKLEKNPEQFIQEFNSGQKASPTLKVIFNNNFKIDDL